MKESGSIVFRSIAIHNPRLRVWDRDSGFWHLHAQPGHEAALNATRSFQSMSHLTKLVAYASLDPKLFMLLQRPEARAAVRQTIIETHLSHYRPLVENAANENQLINEAARKLRQEMLNRKTGSKPMSPAHSAAFRQEIMRLYDYTCAACRLRIITPDLKSAVDAAHIIRFADSHDDVINNGLALCKLHHWAFDEHLIAISDSYKLLVSSNFEERGHCELLLRNLTGKKIMLPSQRPFYPSLINLRQHRAAFNT